VNNRVFVMDGAHANIATSAGVTAGVDLALHLIAQTCGEDIAAAVAQDMVVYLRRGPRDPELSPLLQHRNHLHPAVHRVQDAVNKEPSLNWTMTALAAAAHVTQRHLLRLFTEHAGISPTGYVELIRLEHARRALAGGASVGQAAEVAGFSADLQLRRAWARQWGGKPVDARRRQTASG
ncbi:MAG: helix-turn-helix domain-containing protein, partial [Burkholderiales bacterium]